MPVGHQWAGLCEQLQLGQRHNRKQTPDNQAYINGYQVPSGGSASAYELAAAVDGVTPAARETDGTIGPGPLDAIRDRRRHRWLL